MQLGRFGALLGFAISAIGAGVNYVDPANKIVGFILIGTGGRNAIGQRSPLGLC